MNETSVRFPFAFWKGIVYPLLFWIALTPFSKRLDLYTTRALFDRGEIIDQPVWNALYTFGILPFWIATGFAFAGLVLSFRPDYRKLRLPCLYLILVPAIGAGLLIHAGLKDHWGRPRPRQVKEFGGQQEFRPYYSPNFNNPQGPSKSFSCGHCSAGFYFFSLALLAYSLRLKKTYRLALAFALILGIALSLARIVQGGHFLSDTIASAIIMWWTSWILAYFLLFKDGTEDERSHP